MVLPVEVLIMSFKGKEVSGSLSDVAEDQVAPSIKVEVYVLSAKARKLMKFIIHL